LNTTLDPHQIIERTLECALEITDGEAGLISLEMKGSPPLLQTQGVRMETSRAPQLVAKARELQRATILSTSESSIPPLLPQASSRLIAPIKRENQTLGLIVVESSNPSIFKEASRHVLTILADHAANALENARLFEEMQKEEQRVSLIIESMADGLFTTDPAGTIITFNPAAERLTGWAAEDATGRNYCEILGCELSSGSQESLGVDEALEEAQPHSFDRYVLRQRSGTKRVIAMSMTPLLGASGQSEGSVFLFRDVTEQEEMDRLQRELIAAISHELRAPLANMSSITEMLLSEGSEILREPYSRYLHMLTTQTQRLATFSDKILDIYRLETGQLQVQLRPLPVSLLVENVVRHWQHSTTKCTIQMFLPEKSPWVWADEDGFQTILSNLIDNAVKYSPAGTTVEVRVEEQEDGFIACGVQDQGPGISAEHQSRIFERFYRVDGRDAQTVYGHGLGLYIARNLIDAMKGQIWVESEIGKGSYIAFALPIPEMEVSQ
jgi:PAS domain S-box-containing protein